MTKHAFDVDFINPFLNAVIDVMKTMAQIEPLPGKPFIKDDETALGDISGIIGITGHTKGSISVTFTEPCILPIVSNMLGEEMTELNEEIGDAVGEITNMVAGQARQGLSKLGKRFHAAIPTVVMGHDHEVCHIVNGPVLVIPFTTPTGHITVEVCLAIGD